MERLGRGRGYAYRCPTCRGVFLDIEGVRARRAGGPPVAPRALTNVVASVMALLVIRRLVGRGKSTAQRGC